MIRWSVRSVLVVALCGAMSCATSSVVSPARFANQPTVWTVDDRAAIPSDRLPEGAEFPRMRYFFDQFAFGPVFYGFSAEDPVRAQNVNALDEVPDSTWFHNRIGRSVLTPDAIRRGPNVDDGPDRSQPWMIKGMKVGGASVGFQLIDARGVRYILKFDEKGVPEMETAANVITQRLLWAAGFHVAEDAIVYFDRSQLALAEGAKVSDAAGNKRPMTIEDIDKELRKVNVGKDGLYRGLASKFLAGKPLGGYAPRGVRNDDPNDVVPHQLRRELRGQYVIFSWVDHTDVKSDNTLDMLVTDPNNPDHKYVMHYLVDFGKSLGVMGWIERRPGDGFAYNFDFQHTFASIFGFGLWRRPWDGADGPDLPAVGRFESERFEPHNYKPQYPWDPFTKMDRFDAYWGAKIVARFTRDHIRAAVETGKLSDPRSADYLVKTLVARRDKIVRHWLTRVSPLESFEIKSDRLCFDDLWARYNVHATRDTMAVAAFARDGSATGFRTTASNSGTDRYCVAGVPRAKSAEGYTIVRIVPFRSGDPFRAVEVHIADIADIANVANIANVGGRHVIGVVRR